MQQSQLNRDLTFPGRGVWQTALGRSPEPFACQRRYASIPNDAPGFPDEENLTGVATAPSESSGAVCFMIPPMLTPLLIIASLWGARCAFLVVKQKSPLWFCAAIGSMWGLAYGLLAIDLFVGGL
jgi:hypothetical protein